MAKEKELTVNEVAALLKIPARRIQDSLHAGHAPRAHKEGRIWKIPKGDLLYLRDRKPGRPWHRTILHQLMKPCVEKDLKTKEAAIKLSISIARMKALLAANRVPNAYKKGIDWRIPKASLKFIKDRPPGRPWHKEPSKK